MKRIALHVPLMSLLSVALTAAIAGCNQTPPTQAQAPAPATTAPVADTTPVQSYQPPTAEQLYALVAPIALFPDKLVALTLAASTHPDQVGSARDFLQGNRNLTGAALIDAADAQAWDPSVKSLVAFPAVVDQLAGNADWTSALGAAYAAEPTDVMNAIQVMRERARSHGTLKSSTQQVVQVSDSPAPDDTVVAGNAIVPAPRQTIVIEPAQQDVVYVPQYDPDVVYGEPVYSRVYQTRWYEAPADRGDVVTAGLISFGAGILVGQLFASHYHHDGPHGGWNAWNTSWGGGPRGAPYGGRPAVVYDNHPYTVDRTTVINRTVNNHYTQIDRSTHIDNRHDFGNVDNRHNIDNNNGSNNGNVRNAAPVAAPNAAAQRPDFAHMQRPNFTPAMMHATAANAHPQLPPPAARPDAERTAQASPATINRSPDRGQPGQRPAPSPGHEAPARQPMHAAPATAQAAIPHPIAQPQNPSHRDEAGTRDETHARPATPHAAPNETPREPTPRAPEQQRSTQRENESFHQPRPQPVENRMPPQNREAPQREAPQREAPQRQAPRAQPAPEHRNEPHPAPSHHAEPHDDKDKHGG